MKLLLLWVLASAMAFGVGGRLGTVLSPSRDLIVIGYVAMTASLLLAGVLQWLILRQLIADTGWWVPVSIVSVAIVGVLVFGVGLINRDVGWVLGVAIGWILLGTFQWLVLRGQVAGAQWWVLANTLGLILAIPAVAFVTWATGTAVDSTTGAFLRWLAFGGAYGIVTGTALWWLLQERLPLSPP
ncbi:MAG: hypothetical protein ACR2QM_03130 [Longimicrobiales bacterium]